MMKGMGELYVPKFAKYLERKDLISLTLKSRMEQTEFTRFVDIMSEPSLIDTRENRTRSRFTQTLYQSRHLQHLFHLQRRTPRPGQGDALEGPRHPFPDEEGSENDPLFSKNVWGKTFRTFEKISSGMPFDRSDNRISSAPSYEIVISRPPLKTERRSSRMRSSLSYKNNIFWVPRKSFCENTSPSNNSRRGMPSRKNRIDWLKKIAHRLKEIGTKEAEDILEEFFRNQFIGLEDLTPGLKDKILLERLTDKFLSYTDQFFLQLDQAKEKEKFLAVALSFVKIIPELIRRDRYPEILRILETLKTHFHEKRMWALLAGQILEEIGKGTIPLLLQEKFLTSKKEIRIAIVPIFVSLEVGAIPPLLTLLKTSEDQWVRKNACEALIQIGPVAAVHLLKELNQPESLCRDNLRYSQGSWRDQIS